MLKAFKVPPTHKMARDWEAFRTNRKQVQELGKAFLAQHGFTPEKYRFGNEEVWISLPEDADDSRFVKACDDDGLRRFRQKDKVVKDWQKLLAEKQLTVITMFNPSWYLPKKTYLGSRIVTGLDDYVYVLYESERLFQFELDVPDDFIKITVSTFYKRCEEANVEL